MNPYERLEGSEYGQALLSVIYKNNYKLLSIEIPQKQAFRASGCYLLLQDSNDKLWRVFSKNFYEDYQDTENRALMGGLYRFMRGQDVIYLGKSVNLRDRIKQHLLLKNGTPLARMREEVTGVQYVTLPDADMHVMEMLLISKHKPFLNRDGMPMNTCSFSVDEPEWVNYIGWEALE